MRVISVVLGPASTLGETHMDALETDAADLDYSASPPILIAASSAVAMARAERTISESGWRTGAQLPIEAARDRLAHQGALSGLWIELDRDCGGPMDDLLSQVSRDVADGRYAAIVSAPATLVDPVTASIGDDLIELLIDATDADRAAALAVAMGTRGLAHRVSDVGADKNAERLRQLSEEVSRIASTLARLSTGPTNAPAALNERPIAEGVPPVSADVVRLVIRARRFRARYFSSELFADPAWDMLLDLLQAEIAQLRVPVSSLCIAAAVPATTALRWLKTMVSQGLFVRRADPHDGRRVFVELAPEASLQLRRYFADVGSVGAI
jgi:hypothetical protein